MLNTSGERTVASRTQTSCMVIKHSSSDLKTFRVSCLFALESLSLLLLLLYVVIVFLSTPDTIPFYLLFLHRDLQLKHCEFDTNTLINRSKAKTFREETNTKGKILNTPPSHLRFLRSLCADPVC